MSKGIVLLTALPPHIGHAQLINWASTFDIDSLYVLVCGKDTDPFPLSYRLSAISSHVKFLNSETEIFPLCVLHNLPDYPEQFHGSVSEFDQLWVKEISKYVNLENDDILFASDTYGNRFANSLGIKFIPFDPNREMVKVSATQIRRNPIQNFKYILPTAQSVLRKTITLFGAESTGKTTMAKHLASRYDSVYVSEWARPYLESLPSPEVTDERMRTIISGQLANQKSAKTLTGNPFIFQDTDLFSTLGYFQIMKRGNYLDIALCSEEAEAHSSDLYIVMNSDIRFTPDPLRYGVNKRESNDKFWISLLDKYHLDYYIVNSVNPVAQREEVESVVNAFFLKSNRLWGYER